MSWMGGWFDPELEELFQDDPELLETAKVVRASRPAVEPDPRFQNRLRAQLVAEASRGRAAHGVRRWWQLGPAHFAWGGAAVGVVLIGATVLTLVANHPQDQTITGFSELTAQHSVSPDQVITVAFNQAMNETAVEQGVHIQPATKVSFAWVDNNLVITPAYHLSGNTPYTVTIAKNHIVATSGASAAAPINITFGTAPSAPVSPVSPPTLTSTALGLNGTGGSLLFAPDGSSVVSTAGLAPPPATATATPPTSAGATPTPSPTATPEGVTGSPDVAGALVEYKGAGTTPIRLGNSPTAAAFTSDGFTLGTAVDDGNGGSWVSASQSDGTLRQHLVDSPTPVTSLVWSSNARIIYTDGTSINSVDLSKATASLYTIPPGAGTIALLAPGGAYAYVAPDAGAPGGQLLDIATGADQMLQGAASDVAFSGDGSTVAWVDESQSTPRLLVEPVTQNAPATVSTLDGTTAMADVTLDQDGDEVAYLTTDGTGTTQVVAAQLPSGAPLVVGSPASPSALALSPGGDQIAFISDNAAGPSVELGSVPGATAAHTGIPIPVAANSTLHAFVEAQVRDDVATLASLSGPGVNAASETPQKLSRAYVISIYLDAQGGVDANIELVVDPNASHTTARVASERLTLTNDPAGGGYLVTTLSTTPLRDESSGPHVVQVTSATVGGVTTLQVTFDSDLDASSVSGAISVVSASGTTLASTTVYDPNSRTATVTITHAPAGTLMLNIATSLDDVDSQPLPNLFQATVGATS
jgi:hypothetical protein